MAGRRIHSDDNKINNGSHNNVNRIIRIGQASHVYFAPGIGGTTAIAVRIAAALETSVPDGIWFDKRGCASSASRRGTPAATALLKATAEVAKDPTTSLSAQGAEVREAR